MGTETATDYGRKEDYRMIAKIAFGLVFMFLVVAACYGEPHQFPPMKDPRLYVCVSYGETEATAKGVCIKKNDQLKSDQQDLITILFELKRQTVPLRWIFVSVTFGDEVLIRLHAENNRTCAEASDKTFEDALQKIALLTWSACGEKTPPNPSPPTNSKSILYVHHSGLSGAVVLFL